MMKKIVQRSPDVGIGVRLQKVQTIVEQPKAKALPPVWWGWMTNGVNATKLKSQWSGYGAPDYPYAYFPGHWVAVVEGATSVEWSVEFTPEVWMTLNLGEPVEELVWSGEKIVRKLPQKLPESEFVLFNPPSAEIPAVEFNSTTYDPYNYWEGSYTTPGFPSVYLPSIIAAGNTLSVSADSKSLSGKMVATATVAGRELGSVELNLLRINQAFGS